ncbi:MAG: type II toxin-antitoxin system VapC family toxin [Rhizobium sp.]
MRYLLDTHALIWWLNDSKSLSAAARVAIDDGRNDIFVSAASAWEVTTKHRKGTLDSAAGLLPDFSATVERNGLINLPITSTHMVRSSLLQGAHRDPFDRILSAQAILANMVLITVDEKISSFGVSTLW